MRFPIGLGPALLMIFSNRGPQELFWGRAIRGKARQPVESTRRPRFVPASGRSEVLEPLSTEFSMVFKLNVTKIDHIWIHNDTYGMNMECSCTKGPILELKGRAPKSGRKVTPKAHLS